MFKHLLLAASMLCIGFITKSQNTIVGKISTSDGTVAEGVHIEVKELKKITTSNSQGEFALHNLPDGSFHVIASFAGLLSREKTVELQSKETATVNIILTENSQQLQEVVVNAKKTINNQVISVGKIAIDPMDLPQSISVINQALIKDQQAQRLSDVIRNVNGVYLAGTRAGTQETFYARGYNFSSSNMFKNGSRVNTGIFPEISSLEKVEVLKGSAAILYGNVAPGGIINMITKQPKFYFGGEASLRSGSYGLIKPSVDIYGPLSKKIAYRVNGTYEKSNSYRQTVKSERFYINPSILFKLSNRTSVLLQGDYLSHNFTPDFGIGSIADTIIPNVPRSRFMGANWQYNNTDQATASATLKHALNKSWNLITNLSYQNYKRDYFSIERIQAKANGDWARPLGKVNSREDYAIANLDITGKFKTGKLEHSLLTGIDADRYYTTAYTYNIAGKIYDTINILNPAKFVQRTDMPTAIALTKTQTPVNRIGAYIQDLISISSKLKLLAGIRWSMQQSEAVTTKYLAKDSTGKGKSAKADAFSPRFGLVYRPAKNLSAFASYSNSFTVNSGTDVSGNALAPSIINQYEIGIKSELFNGKLSSNLTIYKIINNNLAQTAPFLADGITPNNNTALKELAGQTTSNGVELDISAQPVTGMNIMAGYSYNDMRYTKTKKAKGNYIEGDRLVNTPANTANASAFYTFQKGKFQGLKFGVSALYIGKRIGGWNNTQGQAQSYNRMIRVNGFTTLDLTAGYRFKKISLLAKLSNIFNEFNYYVHENYSVNPIAPRMFTGTIAVQL